MSEDLSTHQGFVQDTPTRVKIKFPKRLLGMAISNARLRFSLSLKSSPGGFAFGHSIHRQIRPNRVNQTTVSSSLCASSVSSTLCEPVDHSLA